MSFPFNHLALAVAAALVPVEARAQAPAADFDVLTDPKVVAAIRTVWHYTNLGKNGFEAAFRLDGNPSAYQIFAPAPTHQFRRQTVPIVPGVTFALFHVHTAKGGAPPSLTDQAVADQYNLKIYTIHMSGLYAYDPVTKKTTKLRDGVRWIDRDPQ